mmetsp:Transcript_12567/g.25632  ORF Transcript_12567/g.25632 Transcript_12567/m.25632 type:complete len:314 (-) Transcript_12567:93-1034(-)
MPLPFSISREARETLDSSCSIFPLSSSFCLVSVVFASIHSSLCSSILRSFSICCPALCSIAAIWSWTLWFSLSSLKTIPSFSVIFSCSSLLSAVTFSTSRVRVSRSMLKLLASACTSNISLTFLSLSSLSFSPLALSFSNCSFKASDCDWNSLRAASTMSRDRRWFVSSTSRPFSPISKRTLRTTFSRSSLSLLISSLRSPTCPCSMFLSLSPSISFSLASLNLPVSSLTLWLRYGLISLSLHLRTLRFRWVSSLNLLGSTTVRVHVMSVPSVSLAVKPPSLVFSSTDISIVGKSGKSTRRDWDDFRMWKSSS